MPSATGVNFQAVAGQRHQTMRSSPSCAIPAVRRPASLRHGQDAQPRYFSSSGIVVGIGARPVAARQLAPKFLGHRGRLPAGRVSGLPGAMGENQP